METVNLKTLATHCIHATLLAATPIQSLQTKSRTKADGTLITDADGAAQHIIYRQIRSCNSLVRIIGEESDLEMESGSSSSSSGSNHNHNHNHNHGNGSNDNDHDDDNGNGNDHGNDDGPSISLVDNENNGNGNGNDNGIHNTNTNEIKMFQQIEKEMQKHPTTPTDETMDVKRVSIFIDPLDGTSSYVKGYYEAVTILLAIIVDNVPVFGVIGKPFAMGTMTLDCFGDTGCSVL